MSAVAEQKPESRNPSGRNSERLDDVRSKQRAKIIQAVGKGRSLKGAAAAGGISYSTLYEWMKDPKFSEAITRAGEFAVAIVEDRLLDAVTAGDVSAIRFWLERREFHTYGRRTKLSLDDGSADPNAVPTPVLPPGQSAINVVFRTVSRPVGDPHDLATFEAQEKAKAAADEAEADVIEGEVVE